MESAGFIKISRGILDSDIWEDGYDAALYFFFLLRASHNVYGRLKPGQFYSNVVKIARDLGWSRNGTAKHIDSLISKGLVRVSRDPDGTLYTVIGWAEICQEKSKAESISSDVHDMGTGDHEMNKDAHDVNIDAHEMNEDAHDVNKGAHDMNAGAHDMNRGAHNLRTGCPRNEHQNQEQYQEHNQEKPRTLTLYREQTFEIFWKAYPRHEEKSAAKQTWMEMDTPTETLIEALENAKCSRDWLKENGKYIPRAVKWLDGKWEDYIDQSYREERSAWKEY